MAKKVTKKTRKSGVRLDLKERMVIVNYLKDHEEQIEQEGLTRIEVAEKLSALMGKNLTIAHLSGPSEAAGIKWPWGGIRVKLAQFDRKALVVLVGSITDLYIRLNEKMPEGLEDLKHALSEKLREEVENGQ